MPFYDIRYLFTHDNPYEKDLSRRLFNVFKEEITNNYEDFIEFDIFNDSYLSASRESTNDDSEIISDVKKFFKSIDLDIINSNPDFQKEIKEWIGTASDEETNSIVGGNKDEIQAINIPILPIRPLNSSVSYDFNGERLLDYEIVKRICTNIAKSKLNKDEKEIDDLTKYNLAEKRHNLVIEINQFKNVSKINASLQEGDINEMTIDELEYLRDKCETLHKRFMIDEIIRSGFRLGSLAYDTIFPEGIPFGKKRIKIGSISKEFREILLDSRTTRGLSFARILNKYRLNTNDEVTIAITFLEIICSNLQITSPANREFEANKPTNRGFEIVDPQSSNPARSGEVKIPATNNSATLSQLNNLKDIAENEEEEETESSNEGEEQ
jgi:hypothetical protein